MHALEHHTPDEERELRPLQAAPRRLVALPARMDMSNSTRRALPLPPLPLVSAVEAPNRSRGALQSAAPAVLRRLNPRAGETAPQASTEQPVEELDPELLEDLSQDAELPTLAVPKQDRRAEFVPAHPVPGGSGKLEPSRPGKSPRPALVEPLSQVHDPILFVSHSPHPLDAFIEPTPPEPLSEARLADADEEDEPEAGDGVEQEETMPCMRVRLAPRRRMRRALYILTLGLCVALIVLATRSWHPLESSRWASPSGVLETLRGYLGR
jgi:hypothetical protein